MLAVPLAYFGNQFWLQNFANRITLRPGVFLSGVAIMLVLGVLVVASQTLRAAFVNPVESLKEE